MQQREQDAAENRERAAKNPTEEHLVEWDTQKTRRSNENAMTKELCRRDKWTNKREEKPREKTRGSWWTIAQGRMNAGGAWLRVGVLVEEQDPRIDKQVGGQCVLRSGAEPGEEIEEEDRKRADPRAKVVKSGDRLWMYERTNEKARGENNKRKRTRLWQQRRSGKE